MKLQINHLLSTWRNVPLTKKVFFLVGTMIVLVVFELIILSYAMTNLSAVRTYVAGEGEWSKSQKNAFYAFQRFAKTKNQDDYEQIFKALEVVDGDNIARVELNKKDPNLALVKQGFLQGRVHPEDIDKSIYFFRRFQHFYYMKRAIYSWQKGDEIISEFKNLVIRYKEEISSGKMKQSKEDSIIERVQVLDTLASTFEHEFSAALSEGSRWMENQIFLVLFVVVITISAFGVGLAVIITRSITSRIHNLNRLAAEYGLGNFDRQIEVGGKDEIGKLTYSINKMGALLNGSYQQILESHQELEKKVQERTVELKHALTTRDEFLSIANHELRTPLTAIVLQLRILERSVEQCPENESVSKVRESLKKTNRLVKKLIDLQNALMDLTHIQLGKFQVKQENCDLTAIATDSLSQLSLEASRTGVQISTSFPETLSGPFDPIRSSQVITNLVSNAIKYGEGKPIELDLNTEDGKAILVVTDHGPGIPNDKMNTIFDRFERGDHDRSLSGLGLGLYITKQIVEAHGGSIGVHNVEGKGARFKAEFPL